MDKYKAGFKFAMGMIFKHDFHKRECSDNTISCCLYILVSLKLCLKAMYIVAGQTLFKTISRQSYFGSHVSVSTRDQIVCFVTVNFQRALYQIHRTFSLKLPLFFHTTKKVSSYTVCISSLDNRNCDPFAQLIIAPIIAPLLLAKLDKIKFVLVEPELDIHMLYKY